MWRTCWVREREGCFIVCLAGVPHPLSLFFFFLSLEPGQILGPRYANEDPRDVLSCDQYRRDIMQAGPLMGMTFMLTAAREIPALEAAK